MHQGPKAGGPLTGTGLAALARSVHLRAMECFTLANLEDVEGARALVAARWPKLRELRILDIDEAAAKVVCVSDRLEGVRVLALGQLGGEGLTLLAGNRAARSVEALAAWSGLQVEDPIRDPAFRAFVDSEHLQGLRALDAGDWSVGARGLSALSGGGLAKLLSVDLSGIDFDRKAAEALGKAKMAPRTLFLSLESDRLPGNAFGQAFAAMAGLLARVERLGVCSVYEERGDDALAALSAATRPKLKTLFIGGSNQPSFTNAGARTLLESPAFPALAMLRFTARHYLGGGIGKAQLAKLQSRFTCSPDNLPFEPTLFRPVWPA